jgi:hypothetical protein
MKRKTIRELEQEVADLRRKVEGLERRPTYEQHYHYHYPQYQAPAWPSLPYQTWICGNDLAVSTSGVDTTGVPKYAASSTTRRFAGN